MKKEFLKYQTQGGIRMTIINEIIQNMISYYSGDPKRIHHFIKVHSYARLIGEQEGLDSDTQTVLELAAVVHDIGIKIAEKKYGKCNGKLQEQEGPSVAYDMLSKLSISPWMIDRICYLVAHHHTYTNVNGLDYQILLEADLLVNLYEDNVEPIEVEKICNKIFKTSTGKKLCETMYHRVDES